jgi:hypothetical protein
VKRFFLFLTLVVLSFSSAQDIQDDLPVLGDRSSASVSLSGEFEMGRLWLSLFRKEKKEETKPTQSSETEIKESTRTGEENKRKISRKRGKIK